MLGDPVTILSGETTEFRLGIRAIGELCQGVHRQLDAGDRRGRDSFHFGLRNPTRADRPALAVFDHRMCSHAVTDREFAGVAVLQIGHPLVPVVAFQASQVRARHQWLLAVDFHFRLEGERLVAHEIGRRCAAIDKEEAATARAGRKSPFAAGNGHTTHRPCDDHASAVGHSLFATGGNIVGQLDGDNLFARAPLPLLRPPIVLVLFQQQIIAPADGDLELFGLRRDQQTDAHRRRHEGTSRRGRFRRGGVVGPTTIVHLVHRVDAFLVRALVLVGFRRHEKAGQVPPRRRLRQHFVRRAQVVGRAD